MDLLTALTDLASQREVVASWKTVEGMRRTLAEATDQWKEYKDSREARLAAEAKVAEVDALTRQVALQDEARGEHLLEGVSVYNRRTISVADRETLRVWVSANMPAFLVVDDKALAGWLSKLSDEELKLRLPLGMQVERAKAVKISSDLAAYFPGKE